MSWMDEFIPRRKFLELSFKGGLALAATPALLSQLLSCRGSEISQVKPSIDPQLLQQTIAYALRNGGDFAEVYLENRISRRIVMEESKFKSAVFGISQGAGVRVISGNKTGYAYTEEINEANLRRAAEIASTIARGSKKVPPQNIKETTRESFITVEVPLQEIADKKRLEVIQRANQAGLDYDPRIKMVFISYYDEIRGRVIANSEGLLVQDELPLLFFIVQTLAVGDKNRHLGRERLSRHSGFEMFDEVSPEEVARRAAQLRARYRLRPADALQAATALVYGATAFVTNDRQLMRLASLLDVVVLDDL